MINYLSTVIDDKELKKVDNLFNNLLLDYTSQKRLSRFKEDIIDDAYKEISDVLSKRFGFTIELVNNNNKNVSVMPSVSQYAIDLKNRIKKKMEKQVVKRDYNDKIKTVLYTLDKLENELNKGLRVDTNNYKILSDNDFNFKINLDFIYLLKNKISGRELTSIVLHEIGHIYNGILLLPTTVANAVDLTLNIVSSISDNKSPKETILKLADEKNTESEFNSNIVFNLYKSYIIDNNKYFSGYKRSYTNENTADMLAVSFGYGVELSTALSKVTDIIKPNDDITNSLIAIETVSILSYIIFVYGLDTVASILFTNLVLVASITIIYAGIIAFFVWLFSRTLGTMQLNKDLSTHEEVSIRISRIKNKIISTAKKATNKEEAIRAIKEIKSLNGLLKSISESTGVNLGKLKTVNTEYEVIVMADNLINNELFIQSLRLKYMKGE